MKRNILKNYPSLMTVNDVQAILGIGRSIAYNLLKSGELRSVRIRSLYRIPKAYLEDYISKNA